MNHYNIDNLRESMVKILGSEGQTVSGSGFIIRSDGYLITCHHVIYEKDDIFKTLLLLAGRCIAEGQENSHPLITEIIDRIYKFWQCYPSADFINSTVVALGKVNSQMFQRLQDALNHLDSDVREQAALALGKIGNPQAVDALISALKEDSNSEVRSKAAFVLGNTDNPQAVNALISALKDVDNRVRDQAAWSLSMIGNSQAVDALIDTLKHPDCYFRVQAALALTDMNYLQGLEVLNAALNQSMDYLLRLRVIGALGMMRSPQAVNFLIAALNDSHSFFREGVAKDLSKIGNPETLKKLIQLPEIDIYCTEIFLLARTLAVRFSKERLPFIPVYPELVAHKQ